MYYVKDRGATQMRNGSKLEQFTAASWNHEWKQAGVKNGNRGGKNASTYMHSNTCNDMLKGGEEGGG
jgi:hypothetical protein